MLLSLLLLVVFLGLRFGIRNPFVRGRLLLSSALLAAYAAVVAWLTYLPPSPALAQLLGVTLQPLFALALINAIVALAINPWRSERVPDRFPNIVQDTIVIALFAIAATLILQEKIFAATAVGAVVLGFALQDTLGNLFAGLAIQIEKPFRVGQWVHLAGKDGLVSEITWRATKIRTRAGNFVIVPNSMLSREAITNYSEPTLDTRTEVEVGVAYDTPPNRVKAVIREAIRDEPLIDARREPDVVIADFAASGITYRIRVWMTEFGADERVRDRLRTRIYYAFRRADIEIPYPVQIQIERQETPRLPDPGRTDAFEAALRAVDIFGPLSDAQCAELARGVSLREFGAAETIVRAGEPGSSMFVVYRGEASVTLRAGTHEVAHLGRGQFFGEMSLLTGEPRTATVAAATDCAVLEITAADFRRIVLADTVVVEGIASAVARRRAELEQHRAAGAASAHAAEPPQSFLVRMRRFLGIDAP
jgi:small-conductance mechanosensitive channel/CRP-like cAMP-binding protein